MNGSYIYANININASQNILRLKTQPSLRKYTWNSYIYIYKLYMYIIIQLPTPLAPSPHDSWSPLPLAQDTKSKPNIPAAASGAILGGWSVDQGGWRWWMKPQHLGKLTTWAQVTTGDLFSIWWCFFNFYLGKKSNSIMKEKTLKKLRWFSSINRRCFGEKGTSN